MTNNEAITELQELHKTSPETLRLRIQTVLFTAVVARENDEWDEELAVAVGQFIIEVRRALSFDKP